ncbi:MAG TPA: hypothetical protein VIL20_21805 [Sandaracinaceae bacterium]
MARRRTELTREEHERRGRHAIAWGAGTLVLGFAIGCLVAFIPIATGLRIADQAAQFDIIVPIGSAVVALVGLGMLVYGLIELGRGRPRHRREERPA